jgi:predicted ATPase
MLTNIRLGNFKCFNSLSLNLAPLTLLTGFNAAGKSTTLQSILLLAQSLRSGNRMGGLSLNGPLARLGTPGEVLNSGDGDVVFAVEDDKVEIEWSLQAEERSKGSALRVGGIKIRSAAGIATFPGSQQLESLLPPEVGDEAKSLVERLRETIFLSAVRQGTADVFPSPEELSPVHADVGVQGELAPWWFQLLLDEEIDGNRCNQSDEANSLRRQFNAWANELFPGAQGNAQIVERTNLMRLELRIGDVGDWRRPSNIGYGLTYAFPVIVAGLLAKSRQILIIDSPEAHLHPLGQSRMGRFLAQMAAAGVQIIVETHSDHVLNGMRLALRDNLIEPENVAIHFFNHVSSEKGISNRVISPEIDRNGNLSEWPEGFFDQSEKDLARLAGWV